MLKNCSKNNNLNSREQFFPQHHTFYVFYYWFKMSFFVKIEIFRVNNKDI
jgi:hypothetical protein